MKYLKFTLTFLIVLVVANFTIALAYNSDEIPVAGTMTINFAKWGTSATRNKINNLTQRLKTGTNSLCSDCKYIVNTYVEGAAVSTNQKITPGTTVSLNNSSILTGTTYVKIRSNKLTLTNLSITYNYDPNHISL